MDYFIHNGIIFGVIVAIWLLLKVCGLRFSLLIAILGALYFAINFLVIIKHDGFSIWPFFYCLICCIFIIAGGKKVAFKTQTAVFDDITGKPIPGALLQAGSHFTDPMLETVTVSPDGIPNIAGDLQQLMIKIPATPELQTETRGVKARVMDITFMLWLDIKHVNSLLWDIEGGAKTVWERIHSATIQFFHHEISHISAEKLDQEKNETILKLSVKLRAMVNEFCSHNGYPYQIPQQSSVTIGDTELEDNYYEILAKRAFALLDQEAQNLVAEKLRNRLIETGEKLLPNGSEADKLIAAQISLGIVKKEVKESKFSLDRDTRDLARDMAKIFKRA